MDNKQEQMIQRLQREVAELKAKQKAADELRNAEFQQRIMADPVNAQMAEMFGTLSDHRKGVLHPEAIVETDLETALRNDPVNRFLSGLKNPEKKDGRQV